MACRARGWIWATAWMGLLWGGTCAAQGSEEAVEAREKALPSTLRFVDAIPEAPDPWAGVVRVRCEKETQRMALDIGVRTFTHPDKPGIAVDLVGVTHIGERAYYAGLQEFLDGHDLVLFEGVKPSSGTDDLPADDASRVKLTTQRIRILGVLVERHRRTHKALPESLDAVIAGLRGPAARVAQGARTDAWGGAVAYVIDPARRGGFDLVSLGSDKKPGGEGPAGDVRLSDGPPISKREAEGGEGIQVKLAKTLGLEFQLAALDYNRPNWRNSDITVEKLEQRFEEAGVDGSFLFGMLDGSSLGSKLMGFLLGLLEQSPQLVIQTKIMMAEMLAHAEALGGNLGPVMDVLIKDRNAIVMEDLSRVLASEPAVHRVAIFYGAGHLPDMEHRLAAMGFAGGETAWRTAIEVDLTKLEGGYERAEAVRGMVRKMVESQRPAGKPGGRE